MKHFLEKDAIEAALSEVVEKEAHGQVRANLFTLVIVCPLAEKKSYVPMLDSLLGMRPSRIIHIHTGPGDQTSVSVSARCKMSDGRKSVCFEEITIVNGSDNIGIDPRSWAPLLAADMPSSLLWLDRILPLPQTLVRGRELTDKLLIDTTVQEKFGEDLVKVYSALSCIPEEYIDGECRTHDEKAFFFSDFSWHVTNELRLVTSDVFDPYDKRMLLGSIRSVRFGSAQKAHAALYFIWLASRLGWKNEAKIGNEFSFTDESGAKVLCEYAPTERVTFSIRFDFGGGKSCMVEVRDRECRCSFAPEGGTETLLYADKDMGSILLAETGSLVIDTLFNDSVAFASKMV